MKMLNKNDNVLTTEDVDGNEQGSNVIIDHSNSNKISYEIHAAIDNIKKLVIFN